MHIFACGMLHVIARTVAKVNCINCYPTTRHIMFVARQNSCNTKHYLTFIKSVLLLFLNWSEGLESVFLSIYEWVSFLAPCRMNPSEGQAKLQSASRAICLFRAPIYSEWTKKKDTHSLYLQCFLQWPFLKFSERSSKFKFPTIMGTLKPHNWRNNHSACDLPDFRTTCLPAFIK